jgi:hypothetical protein
MSEEPEPPKVITGITVKGYNLINALIHVEDAFDLLDDDEKGRQMALETAQHRANGGERIMGATPRGPA